MIRRVLRWWRLRGTETWVRRRGYAMSDTLFIPGAWERQR